MALTKKVEAKCGVILEQSYIKIIEQSGNKEAINIRVAFYKDKVAHDVDKEYLDQETYSFIPNLEENFIKQGYEYLKELPEYATAQDC